jgi:hypothetical protein
MRLRERHLGAHECASVNHAAFGWRIHGGLEVTELSTNKQLSLTRRLPSHRRLLFFVMPVRLCAQRRFQSAL